MLEFLTTFELCISKRIDKSIHHLITTEPQIWKYNTHTCFGTAEHPMTNFIRLLHSRLPWLQQFTIRIFRDSPDLTTILDLLLQFYPGINTLKIDGQYTCTTQHVQQLASQFPALTSCILHFDKPNDIEWSSIDSFPSLTDLAVVSNVNEYIQLPNSTNCSGLQRLQMKMWTISEPIAEQLNHLGNLLHLYMGTIELTQATIRNILQGVPQLKTLSVGSCGVENSFDDHIMMELPKYCPHLTALEISNCVHVTNRGFECIYPIQLQSLQYHQSCYMDATTVDSILKTISHMKILIQLNILYTNVTSDTFKQLCQLPSLKVFKFGVVDSNGNGILPEDWFTSFCSHLLVNDTLQKFVIGTTSDITAEQLCFILEHTTLTYLNLQPSQCTPDVFNTLCRLKPPLHTLHIGDYELSIQEFDRLVVAFPGLCFFSEGHTFQRFDLFELQSIRFGLLCTKFGNWEKYED
jgi:hypothetical protein